MTFNDFIGFVAAHWVILGLALCPIVVVLMALAALSCEACGAPFGVFRRRSRTIDLCLRCALIHDFRAANEDRAAAKLAARAVAQSVTVEASVDSPREDRRLPVVQPASLDVAGHAGRR